MANPHDYKNASHVMYIRHGANAFVLRRHDEQDQWLGWSWENYWFGMAFDTSTPSYYLEYDPEPYQCSPDRQMIAQREQLIELAGAA